MPFRKKWHLTQRVAHSTTDLAFDSGGDFMFLLQDSIAWADTRGSDMCNNKYRSQNCGIRASTRQNSVRRESRPRFLLRSCHVAAAAGSDLLWFL
jgi:hypothetical protein